MDIKEKEDFKAAFRNTDAFTLNFGGNEFAFKLNASGEFYYSEVRSAWQIWQAKAQAVPKCTWLQNEDGYFDTSCRQSFVFTEPEDKPHDHRFTHCCFCGGRLIEAQEPAND
ncbi:hypothetical protein [Acinetobacter sp.]|uniref:hypothetical protein n=1 Tax=Acinetobacter sp. TaxID=472 RepID=UPI00289A414C|nr:hypothetical protein [Acinetobacter sp.]